MTHQFDDTKLAHLKACRAQGMNLRDAAKEMGISRDTMRLAIINDGYTEQVQAMYPGFGVLRPNAGPKRVRESEMQRLSVEDIAGTPLKIDWTPQVRWLTKVWRKAA